MSIFLFSSASFLATVKAKNKFSPFWVYIQWNKLNLAMLLSMLFLTPF